LITKDEKETRDLELLEAKDRAQNAGKDAEARKAKLDANKAELAAENHAEVIDEKNALINKIRKSTGQEVHKETNTEVAQAALAEKLKQSPAQKQKTYDELRAEQEAEAKKSKDELLEDKNKIVADIKAQSEKTNAEREAIAKKK
jgi:uncharacterized protein YydD (DUF2326 family)